MDAVNPYTLPVIDFVGGSTQDFAFHCYFHADSRPFDLSSCTANFSLVNYANKYGEPLVSKQMKIGAATSTGRTVYNVLSVTLNPSDTVNLSGKYIYQIIIRDISGYVEIPSQGIIHIVNNINKLFIG